MSPFKVQEIKGYGGAKEAADRVVANVDDIPVGCRKPYENAPEVGVAVKVIAITDLDMSGHSFSVDFNLNVAWKGEKDNMPEVQFYNILESQEHEQADTKAGDAGFDWYYRIRCRASFRQNFAIRDFPFDTQALTVQVRMKKPCMLVHLPWDLSGRACSCDPRCLMDEFVLTQAQVVPTYLPSLKFGKLAGYDPEAHIVFSVARKPMYWVINYGLITSVLASFSFLAFALPVGDISDRLGIGFTLNLTVVASYYLMSDKLPCAAYFNALEKHILTCMAVTMFVLVENASPKLLGEPCVAWFESSILPVLLVLWLVYHGVLAITVFSYRVVDG